MRKDKEAEGREKEPLRDSEGIQDRPECPASIGSITAPCCMVFLRGSQQSVLTEDTGAVGPGLALLGRGVLPGWAKDRRVSCV